MTILPDLSDLDLQIFEIISKIKDLESNSWIFEIISKILKSFPVFLKYVQKYGSPNHGFLKYFQKYEVQIFNFYANPILGPDYGF